MAVMVLSGSGRVSTHWCGCGDASVGGGTGHASGGVHVADAVDELLESPAPRCVHAPTGSADSLLLGAWQPCALYKRGWPCA